ncbi:MAG: conjugal transfer protein TraG, partial [Planctomycetota bacterium]|nr:conjugal transfer protein TraG [Planctomycetota bacterium]
MNDKPVTVGYAGEEKRHTGWKILFVLLAMLAGLAAATQVFAHKFAYDPALGGNINRVYFPGMIVFWAMEWGEAHPAAVQTAAAYGMAMTAGLLIAFIVIARIASQSARGNAKLHGTAHWASSKEVKASGLLDNPEGVYVGAWLDDDGVMRYLRDNGPSHVLCFA